MEKQLLTTMKKHLIIPLICILPLSAAAETLYVSDTLRVGIRAEPNSKVPSLTVAKSGTKLELISKKGSYAKVRTASGIEGWVKSAYLSKNKPYLTKWKEAKSQLNTLESKIKELENAKSSSNAEENNQLKQTISDLEKDNQALLEQVQSLKTRSANLNNIKKSDNNELTLNLKESSSNLIYIALGVITVILVLGFLFGVSWHKKQVTKRLGGLSI